MKNLIIALSMTFLLLAPVANYLDKAKFEQKYEMRRSYKDVFGVEYEEIEPNFEK